MLFLARGLELFQHSQVLLDGPVDALLIEREELELFRLLGESVSGGEGGVDLGDVGAGLAPVLKLAEGEEVVFYGTNSVEPPTVGGDALGELVSMAPSGARSWIKALVKLSWAVRSSSVIVVTWPVMPWRRAFMLERTRPVGSVGPWDVSALRRLAAYCKGDGIIDRKSVV